MLPYKAAVHVKWRHSFAMVAVEGRCVSGVTRTASLREPYMAMQLGLPLCLLISTPTIFVSHIQAERKSRISGSFSSSALLS
jgi:hypothetical protein